MTAGIYRIRNTVNGRVYIGSSAGIHKRWLRHRWALNRGCHCNPGLQAAWDKHGADAFAFEVIEEVADPGTLRDREQWWLDTVRPYLKRIGYNIARDAEASTRGLPVSEERRRQLSEQFKGVPKTPEHRDKIRAALAGKSKPWLAGHYEMTPARAAALNERNERYREFGRSEEVKRKVSASLFGRKATEEARRNMSQARRGRKQTPESTLKTALANLNPYRFHDEKPCSKCGIIKPREQFNRRLGKSVSPIRDPHLSLCKACQSAWHKAHRAKQRAAKG